MEQKKTLREIATLVGNYVNNSRVMERIHDWVLINGDDRWITDTETGLTLTKDEVKAYDNGQYDGDVEIESVEIYQYFIISSSGADYLIQHTDEIVYYSPSFEMYVLGIDELGTPWEGLTRAYYEDTGRTLVEALKEAEV